MIDQEKQEGSAALPSKHASKRRLAFLFGHVSIHTLKKGRRLHGLQSFQQHCRIKNYTTRIGQLRHVPAADVLVES